MENWKQLTHAFNHEIKKVLQLQHLAAQFISLTGRYLLPEKEDESNVAMQYLPDKEMLLGRQHPDGWLVSLELRSLLVHIRDDNMTVLGETALDGKTFPEALIAFKKELHKTGADVSLIRNEQPYELPDDSLDEGLFFTPGPEYAVHENILYRHNANLVLQETCSGFAGASPVFIWPNHFDTGFSFPIEHNNEGDISKTVGMGWAIPDEMVDEPYYYLSFYSDEPLDESSRPGALPAGKWMMPEWNGAVLKLSEIVAEKTAAAQRDMVRSFLETGVKRLTEHFDISH